ncbi:MAG: hypothetical protein Q9160_004801 [Pyrenula sp. 1 TL-2023]
MLEASDGRGPAIVKTAIVSPIIASLFVFLRLYSRAYLTRGLGWDDLVSVLTLLSSITYSVLISYATYNGMGRHEADMTDELTKSYMKWIVISSEFYLLTLLGYKLAILMSYHRIFFVSQRFIYICRTTMFITAAYLVCNMITQVTGCQPLRKFWDHSVPGHCVNFGVLDRFYGAMNVLTDFAIAILPLRTIWRLRMDRREKIGVSLVFLIGIIAFAVALVRWILTCVDHISHDRTYLAGMTFLWSILEVNTGLMCACCLPLKPLLKHVRTRPIFVRATSSFSRKSDSNQPSDLSKNSASSPYKVVFWPLEGRESDASDHEPVLDTVDREMRRLGGISAV